MKNREYFLRQDIKTYKKKFLRLCNKCEFKLVNVKDNSYICTERKQTIKIIEL